MAPVSVPNQPYMMKSSVSPIFSQQQQYHHHQQQQQHYWNATTTHNNNVRHGKSHQMGSYYDVLVQ
jgi:hypothetical protein